LNLYLFDKITGIAYDDDTLKHECYCKRTDLHLENPRRLLVIYEELKKCHLLDDCEIIRGFCATIDMLTECHEYEITKTLFNKTIFLF
jgi:hypothetical protein